MIALKANQKSKNADQGVRPLDLRRDVGPVSSLLELVFHQHIGRAGRQALSPGLFSSWPRWGSSRSVPGFVYVLDGRIVGNVSLLQGSRENRYLVANVAVHPDFRRRGIGRQMMNQVLRYVEERRGSAVVLQVEEDNTGAIDLYQSLKFKQVGTALIWHLSHYHIQPIASTQPINNRKPDQYDGFRITPLRSDDWLAAYELDRAAFPLAMQWPEPVTRTSYKPTIWKSITGLLNGTQQEIWVAKTDDRQLVGLAAIETTWGRPHVLRLRLNPEWANQVARPLLAKVLRRLRYHSRRPILIDQLKDDAVVEPLLREAHFQKRRTLTTMIHHFGDPNLSSD